MNQLCRLCLSNSNLVESHIIPRFSFSHIRNESIGNRFISVSNDIHKIIQDGPKEYLLCSNCEQSISRWEKYFKETIHFQRHGVTMSRTNTFVLMEGLNYKDIKLFFISLLWKMSASTLKEFAYVKLAKEEGTLRKMILDNQPGEVHDYGVSAVIPLIGSEWEKNWCTVPYITTSSGVAVYNLILFGILFSIYGARENGTYHSDNFLNNSKSWIMPLKRYEEIPSLFNLIRERFKLPD